MPWNLNIDNFYIGIPLIILGIILVIFGHIFVHKYLGTKFIKGSHEVVGYYFSIVATIYAVTLGLVVVDSLKKYDEAAKIMDTEASAVLTVYQLGEQFHQSATGHKIQDLTKKYLDEVLTNDWSYMDQGKLNYNSRGLALGLIDLIKIIEPTTLNEQILLPQILSSAKTIWDSRRERFVQAVNGINALEWFALLLGAFITLIFTYFFTMENYISHIIMVGLVSLIIFLNLYIVKMFGEPFTGSFLAPKTSLILAYNTMHGIGPETNGLNKR